MSEAQEKNGLFVCPFCEKQVELTTYPVVDVQKQPELREDILSGEFFRLKCPHCGKRMKIRRQVVYVDRDHRFLICLIPSFTENQLREKTWERQDSKCYGFTKRIVANVNALKEKILMLENGIDDRAIELCKLAVSGVVRKKYNKPIRAIYFARFDEAENVVGFSFQFAGEKEMTLYQTKMTVYEISNKVANAYDAQRSDAEKEGFLRVGPRWAKDALDWYQEKGEE